VTPQWPLSIHCTAADADGLLYEWVNAPVYEMATRHQPAVEVKGATGTDLRVGSGDGRWTAQ
jgi:hypothetical protein